MIDNEVGDPVLVFLSAKVLSVNAKLQVAECYNITYDGVMKKTSKIISSTALSSLFGRSSSTEFARVLRQMNSSQPESQSC